MSGADGQNGASRETEENRVQGHRKRRRSVPGNSGWGEGVGVGRICRKNSR